MLPPLTLCSLFSHLSLILTQTRVVRFSYYADSVPPLMNQKSLAFHLSSSESIFPYWQLLCFNNGFIGLFLIIQFFKCFQPLTGRKSFWVAFSFFFFHFSSRLLKGVPTGLRSDSDPQRAGFSPIWICFNLSLVNNSQAICLATGTFPFLFIPFCQVLLIFLTQ